MNMAKTISLAKSLYHLGKIRLTEAGPEIMGQQVIIVPRDLFTRLIELYAADPILEQAIYRVMHKSVYGFCEDVDDARDLDSAELLQILMHLSRLNGYGHIEINEYDEEKHVAAFYVRDLPSEDVQGDYVFKGDTYWAGMLAGGMSYVFQEDVDGLETQCVLEGENSCRFLIAPRKTLREEYPELYRKKFESARMEA